TSATASAGKTWPPVPPAMISTVGSAILISPAAFAIDAQHQRQQNQADDQTAAAITQEGQRQTLGRQQPDIYADVDEYLRAQQQPGAVGNKGAKQLAQLFGAAADTKNTREQNCEQSQHGDGADEAKLFCPYREHEIGMRFRQ